MKSINVGFFFIISGAVVLAVCVYLDQKRHQDPLFRKKLREKRQKLKHKSLPAYQALPKDIDPKYREVIIINEIKVAEDLMSRGELEGALIHFAHAISVCADPGHLLDCLYKTLPLDSYELLINLLVKMYGDRFRLRPKIQNKKENKEKGCKKISKKLSTKTSNMSAISKALTF